MEEEVDEEVVLLVGSSQNSHDAVAVAAGLYCHGNLVYLQHLSDTC